VGNVEDVDQCVGKKTYVLSKRLPSQIVVALSVPVCESFL